ncbi:MAG: thiolase family protein [Thermodesulfobacteriota bacterium]|nr:thiolase family protein [Thermodesulfobacteriota bacterium]
MANKRVAICAVAQHKNESDMWYKRFQGMLLDVLEDIQAQTGVDFSEEKGVTNIVSCSDDVFDARTISDNGVTDVLGAQYRGEEKMAQEGLNGVGYAMSIILSGHDDLVYLAGHCKESQPESRDMCTNLGYDPFYGRAMGLDFTNVAGLQARAYMEKSGVTEEHLAKIVVRARQWAARNPYANATELVEPGEVIASPMLCDPIRRLHAYPVSDGAVAMLLASEDRAREFTDNPIWITGFANCMDSYFLGDRDLAGNSALKKAAERAYGHAGIKDPEKSIDLVEVMDAFAYQQPMWMEGLGLCEEGKGDGFIDEAGPARYNVNLSGGMLAGNPIMVGGMYRVAEAVLQLKGEAGEHQVSDVNRAIAHSTTGGAGQFHTVVVLER